MSFVMIGAKRPADDSEMDDNKKLLGLLEASYLSSPEECETIAACIASLMREALDRRDAAFFGELIKAFKAEAKLHRLPILHQAERIALSSARRKLMREGNSRPAWREVVELAQKKFGLGQVGKRTLRRIRSEIGASRLPNPHRGKAKKGGQKTF